MQPALHPARIGKTKTPFALHRWGPAVAGGVAGLLLAATTHRALADDAYIALGYAQQLAETGTWGLIPGQTANSATSALNVWLLTAGTWVTGSSVVAAGMVLVVTLAVVGWWTRRLTSRPVAPYLVVGLLATSPLLVSTVGLEMYLGAALLIGVARYAATDRAWPAGILLGLLVLCRPDYTVPGVVLTVVLVSPRVWWRSAAAAVLVSGPWLVTSWVVLGSAIPDTFVFKTVERGLVHVWWDGATVGSPLAYLDRFPTSILLLTAAPAVVGVGCLLWAIPTGRHRVGVAFGLAGISHWAALAALGVPPYLWYFAPLLVALMMCAVLVLPTEVAWPPAVVVTVAGAVIVGWMPPYLPLVGNYATAQEYRDVGAVLRYLIPPDVPVGGPGEVGTITYTCQCQLLDKFTYRPLAAQEITHAINTAGPVRRWLLELNYRNLSPQPAPVAPVWQLQARDVDPQRRPDDLMWWPATMPWHPPSVIALVRGPST